MSTKNTYERQSSHQVDTEEVEDASGVRLFKNLTKTAARQHHHRLRRPLQGVAGKIIERRTGCRVPHQTATTTAASHRLGQCVCS